MTTISQPCNNYFIVGGGVAITGLPHSPTRNGNAVRDNGAKSNRNRQRPHSFLWWAYRYRLSTDHGQRKHRVTYDIHGYDRRARANEHYLSGAEFTYRLSVIASSAAVFSVGIGQCLTELASR